MELREVEKQRREFCVRYFFRVFLSFVSVLAFSVYILVKIPVFWFFCVFFLFVFLSYRRYLRGLYFSRWDEFFKKEVLIKILEKHFQDFVFKPFNYQPLSEFNRSMLFSDYPKPNVYGGENYLEGRYRGISFSLSWISAGYERFEEDDDGDEYTVYYRIFRGIFIKTEFFKNVDGYVLVYPPGKKKSISLDHPEFDKYFSVYASSEFEAYYVLDHAFMERLMKLKDSLGKSIRLSFQGKTLYIAIEDVNFLPTPSLFRSLEKVDLESYVREVKKVLEFLEACFSNKMARAL